MGRTLAAAVVGLTLLCAAGEARASFHLMQVVEVYGGALSSPSAQYVVLQMYVGSQNFVGNTSVAVYDSANVELGRFVFPGSVSGNASQSKILIATTQAATQFGVTADLTMLPVIPAAGGKVCFEAGVGSFIDCVAWGNHPGSAAGGGAGNVGPPLSPVLGLRPGRAAVRRLDTAGSPTVLDGGDDTNHSANDFRVALPAPRNNANQNGTLPASVCGNSSIEGLESCDDGGTAAGDGCDATCLDEACGDGVDNDAGETCDDGNGASGDGCDANCTVTACGNGIVTSGEDCEPPSTGACDAQCQLGCQGDGDCADTDECTTNERCTDGQCTVEETSTDDGESCTNDHCGPLGEEHVGLPDGATCELTGVVRPICIGSVCGESRCGDGYVDDLLGGTEACDDGNTVDNDACTAACTVAVCGDGTVHAGVEACDDGNAVDTDACTSACTPAECGDGFIQAGESCDDANNVSGDGCNAGCALESCGDGVEQLGEQCDDGNQANGDGCTIGCRLETAPPDEGGCCGTAGAAGASPVLALSVLLALGRRRRRAGAARSPRGRRAPPGARCRSTSP